MTRRGAPGTPDGHTATQTYAAKRTWSRDKEPHHNRPSMAPVLNTGRDVGNWPDASIRQFRTPLKPSTPLSTTNNPTARQPSLTTGHGIADRRGLPVVPVGDERRTRRRAWQVQRAQSATITAGARAEAGPNLQGRRASMMRKPAIHENRRQSAENRHPYRSRIGPVSNSTPPPPHPPPAPPPPPPPPPHFLRVSSQLLCESTFAQFLSLSLTCIAILEGGLSRWRLVFGYQLSLLDARV